MLCLLHLLEMPVCSVHLGLKFIRRAFSGVNLAFGMLTRECFLECTFNWLDYSTGIKDETQTHCFTGFSRMVSLVIPNVGFASLLPQLAQSFEWTLGFQQERSKHKLLLPSRDSNTLLAQ